MISLHLHGIFCEGSGFRIIIIHSFSGIDLKTKYKYLIAYFFVADEFCVSASVHDLSLSMLLLSLVAYEAMEEPSTKNSGLEARHGEVDVVTRSVEGDFPFQR